MKTKDQEKLAQVQSLRQRIASNNALDEPFESRGETLDTRKVLDKMCEIFERRAKAAQPD